MNPEAQRIAIAEACGIATDGFRWGFHYWPPFGDDRTYSGGYLTQHDAQDEADRLEGMGFEIGGMVGRRIVASDLPDYPNDLNAMRKAESRLSPTLRDAYYSWLSRIVERKHRMATNTWLCITSDPEQRSEAFLRTIGKWEESP